MMKYWLALLVLFNALVLAWQLDAFARWGSGPNQEREPERLGQQINPEALKFQTLTAPAQKAPAAPESQPASNLPAVSDGSDAVTDATADSSDDSSADATVDGTNQATAAGQQGGQGAAPLLAPAPATPSALSAAPSAGAPAPSVPR
jgi:hypothetical protein